jgi:DNA-binding HxlR family transcriptional regulator
MIENYRFISVFKSFLVTFGYCKGKQKNNAAQEGTNKKHSHQMETITAFTEEQTQKKISEILLTMPTSNYPICPIKDILHTVGDKWSVLVMVLLGGNKTMRFNEIKNGIGVISQKMLTVTLRELESFGLVDRKVYAQIPPKVEYTITPMGEEFVRHLAVMIHWACSSADEISKHRNKVLKS